MSSHIQERPPPAADPRKNYARSLSSDSTTSTQVRGICNTKLIFQLTCDVLHDLVPITGRHDGHDLNTYQCDKASCAVDCTKSTTCCRYEAEI